MITAFLSAFFLVAGAALCLVASVGVLRLPDYFMRMHAATKAGVAGSGFVLIGVGFAEPSTSMWLKVTIGILFLLLTTPIAGHLLGRAGYVAGVPLRTKEDHLIRELPRGDFERPFLSVGVAGFGGGKGRVVRRVALGLTSGPETEMAIDHAIALAKTHGADLVGLAIIDTKMLKNVGPVPIGGNYWAEQVRNTLIGKARHALADVVQAFERAAGNAGVRFSVQVEEGNPVLILRGWLRDDTLLVVGRGAWFDQGASGRAIDPMSRLARAGIKPVIGVPPA